jgi:hypothetical protein
MHGIIAKGFDINPESEYCEIANLFNGHDIVTFWDSIEHLSDPVSVLRGLNPESVFISTPSTDDFPDGETELIKWHHYYPGEHLHYFNSYSLNAMLGALDYSICYKDYSESKYRRSGGDKNIITIGGHRGSY